MVDYFFYSSFQCASILMVLNQVALREDSQEFDAPNCLNVID